MLMANGYGKKYGLYSVLCMPWYLSGPRLDMWNKYLYGIVPKNLHVSCPHAGIWNAIFHTFMGCWLSQGGIALRMLDVTGLCASGNVVKMSIRVAAWALLFLLRDFSPNWEMSRCDEMDQEEKLVCRSFALVLEIKGNRLVHEPLVKN